MADLAWARLRKMYRHPEYGFNAEVYRHFRNDTGTNRLALRDQLLIQATDSRTTANSKIQFFREQVQKVHLKPTVIGLEKHHFDEHITVVYRPMVILFFRQDLEAARIADYPAISARISFRLMNETNESLTDANVRTLATQIKNELALPRGYTFEKGKCLCKYVDKENGYDLQLYTVSDAEGEQVARKIVGLRNHTFLEDRFAVTAPRRDPVNTTANTTILGTTYKKPRWRPRGVVRFMYAELLLHTRPNPIVLVDRSGIRANPLERVLS
jgi:hypothetical protein